ncbi:MAG: DUF1080 domain-containing protein [Chthoniobacter sp.]|nr:DUF1080 domain-containing protein [Chthoniobacter sp.]
MKSLLPWPMVSLFAGIVIAAFPGRAQESVPAGFKPLFNGHSLEGWHTAPRIGVPKTAGEALAAADKPQAKGVIGSAQAEATGRWEVRDGLIVGGQDERRMVHKEDNADWGLGSWLMSDATYGDFELLVDARPDWPCDTGIYVRSTALGQGFQVLLDHRGDDTGGLGGGIGFLFLRGIGGVLVNPHNFRWTVGGGWAAGRGEAGSQQHRRDESRVCGDERGLPPGMAPERLEYLSYPRGGRAAADHRVDQ